MVSFVPRFKVSLCHGGPRRGRDARCRRRGDAAQRREGGGARGRVVCIGFPGRVGPKLKLEELILKNVTVRGITVGSKAHLEALCALVSEHGIVPPIDEVFPMAKAEEAFAHLETGRHFGKVCIDVSGGTAR